MSNITFTETEIKVLELALKDDDRVQQHYHEIFNCHYLPDIVQHLRRKLENVFAINDGMNVLATERHPVIKKDGTKATIGIYRLAEKYKPRIKKLMSEIKSNDKKTMV